MSGATPEPEDQARADFYALLARLFYAPPDRDLLEQLAASGPIEASAPDAPLSRSWDALRSAAASADPDAVRDEYEATFVGTGRAEVTLYTGAYRDRPGAAGSANSSAVARNSLVQIRAFLDRHGLSRRPGVSEPEDHFAALCETMRHLILRGEGMHEQRSLFALGLEQAAAPLCDAIRGASGTHFYKHVAAVAGAFMELEHEAFEMS